MLATDHWLSKPQNVLVLRLSAPTVPHLANVWPGGLPLAEQMRRWSVAEVVSFLRSHDLEGPARTLFANGVRGEDFIAMLPEIFVRDFKLSEFAAGRIQTARATFLSAGRSLNL